MSACVSSRPVSLGVARQRTDGTLGRGLFSATAAEMILQDSVCTVLKATTTVTTTTLSLSLSLSPF